MHIEALKISFWLVQKPRKHRSWLAGRGWQVVVAELIPVTWPKTSHLIGSNQIFNHDHDRIAASYTKPLPEPMLRKVCVSIWCHQAIMGSRQKSPKPWWRHQMEIFSALLAICAGNSPVTGEFPAQRPVTRSFDFVFDLRLNKPLSKQWWGWWLQTLSRPLWRHGNEYMFSKVHGATCRH